jgi:hypothetical protein
MQNCVFAASTRNLALHKKLDYVPKPEHRLTAHPSDPFLLTDGMIDKSLWYEQYRGKTVGWAGAKLIEITIDLGQIYNVRFVNLYTVGCGQPDVEYPEYVVVVSSIDGYQFGFSNFVSRDAWNLEANQATPKVFKLTVEQPARYIKLYVRPTDYYFFTDEIEVFESQSPRLDSLPGDYLSKNQTIDLVERTRQLQRDIKILKTRIDELIGVKDFLQSELSGVETAVTGLTRKISLDKVSEVESQFSVFRRKVLHLQYNDDWLLYQVEPMDILRSGDFPNKMLDDVPISLYQWQNEYSVVALNLVNCSNSQIMFKANISPLRFQESIIDSKGIFELRRAVYVRVQNAGLVADPLVLQNSKSFPVAPGETVQLWLETYAKGLSSGTYTAALAIDAVGEAISKIQHIVPITLEVADRVFPNKIPFLTCNWDYVTISDRFTSKKPELVRYAIRDLENHRVNVFVMRLDSVFNEDKSGLSLQKLQNELALRSGVHPFVLMHFGWTGYIEQVFGPLQTVRCEENLKIFLDQFRDYMLRFGYDYDSFALYPVDESIGEDFVYIAQIIRDFDPRLKIYANMLFASESQFKKVKDLVDIWCPHLPEVIANQNTFDRYKNFGSFDEIWCYNANIAKPRFFSPKTTTIGKRWRGGPNATAFWTMPIVAASLGMTGTGFWVYQDENKAGWTDDTMGDHGVVYEGKQNPDKNCIPEPIVPSKRWRQWRQGVEDAVCLIGHKELLSEFLQIPNSKLTSEYLTLLRKRADKAKDTSNQS